MQRYTKTTVLTVAHVQMPLSMELTELPLGVNLERKEWTRLEATTDYSRPTGAPELYLNGVRRHTTAHNR